MVCLLKGANAFVVVRAIFTRVTKSGATVCHPPVSRILMLSHSIELIECAPIEQRPRASFAMFAGALLGEKSWEVF